jgi:trigger factor
LKSEILSQERNIVVVKANFDADEVDRAVGKTVRDLSKKARIKGFRPGHVPRKTLELYFGRSGIYKETVERMAQEAVETVVSECDLDLITTPETEIGGLTEGAPLDMKFTFEVRPEVTLPDIASVTAEKIIYRVEDSDVEAALKQVLEAGATLVPVEEDRPAEVEDTVETEHSSYALEEDDNLRELEHSKKSILTLATLRRDISQSIVGHRTAEEFTFDIRLEDDYPDRRMAGTTLRYKMEILRILRRVVPEATDEAVSELSKGKYSTVDGLRDELRSQLESDAAERSAESLRESSLKALTAASDVDVPDSMIERQYATMRSEQDGSIWRDIGQSLSDYLKDNNLSVDEYDANLRKSAADIVRNTLVIEALAERDGISFTSDDINEEIMKMANAARMNPQELADSLGKDKERFASVVGRVRTRNTLNHLASLMQVKEVDPPVEDELPPDDEHSPEGAYAPEPSAENGGAPDDDGGE